MPYVEPHLSDLDARRRRLKFRAWHRGMLETDLILGPFYDSVAERLTGDEIVAFERLLDVPDRDLLAWVMGQSLPPPDHDTSLFRSLMVFHNARPNSL